ncbi:MAG: TrkH family potassium uptake protein, partial [Burkholderiaceae bacterium]|nr:TrkH family potassium uptake protein [Burkholderiaceae bacterium]
MFRTLRHLLLPVLNALSALLVMLSLTMFVPLAIAYRDNESTMLGFAISIAITAGSGLALFFMTRRQKRELEARDGFLLVTLSWLAVSLFSSIPFYLLLPNVSYSHLFFEAVSCLTTTGASALNNLNELPVSINYWRCLLSWLGG